MNLTKPPKGYKEFLRSQYFKVLETNPKYSLRAFAKKLGVNSGTLSQAIRGTRPLGPKFIKKTGVQLGLALEEINQFIENELKVKCEEAVTQPLDIDQFKIISEWHYFAILEMTLLKSFQPCHLWIAKKLNLHPQVVNDAIERLVRVGLLKIDDKGLWQATETNLSTLDKNFTNAALKKLQTQYLTKATEALENIPFEQRHQSALTVAVNPEDLDLIKEKINKFRRELNGFLQSRPEASEVYQLTLSLYPLTETESIKIEETRRTK